MWTKRDRLLTCGSCLRTIPCSHLAQSRAVERWRSAARAHRHKEGSMGGTYTVRQDPDPGGAWLPACAGMTTTRRAPSVDTPEYITRSRCAVVVDVYSYCL